MFLYDMILLFCWVGSFIIYMASISSLRMKYERQLDEKDRTIRLLEDKIKDLEKRG